MLGRKLAQSLIPKALRQSMQRWQEVRQWIKNGKPVPPPHAVKQAYIASAAEKYGVRTLVETGTYRGDMIAAMLRRFDRIISVELDDTLHQRARQRFAKERHVELIHGDSGEAMPGIIKSLTGSALFWLDGHYSGPGTAMHDSHTPINKELACIIQPDAPAHVVLIDDARDFGTTDYPTIEQVVELVYSLRPDYKVLVEADIIHILPAD